MARMVLVFLLIAIFQIQRCFSETSNDLTNTTSKDLFALTQIGRKLGNLWSWVKDQSRSEETFIGRCFGIGKKLRLIMPLMIFLLGVIVTMMKFLTLFTLKGVGIGLLLLMLNVGGLFAKLGAFLKNDGHQYHQPQTVHFHIHSKDGQYHVEPSTTGWADRVSQGLSSTNNLAEKMELINLYKRLGFKTDNLPVLRYS